MCWLSTIGATPIPGVALAADTAMATMVATFTVVDIRLRDFRSPWAIRITVIIHRRILETSDSQVTTGTRVMVEIMGSEGLAHGTTRAISTTARLLPFVIVVISTISEVITTCIARATGIVMAADFDVPHACRLVVGRRLWFVFDGWHGECGWSDGPASDRARCR